MSKGILFSILAGLMISFQNIFNARISGKIGFLHTNVFVHGIGFLTAFIILLFFSKINFSDITQVNKVYLLSGVFGALVLFCIMKGISHIGASYAITTIIVTQILFAFVINLFGMFGEAVIPLTSYKVIGIVLMIFGVILYQLG